MKKTTFLLLATLSTSVFSMGGNPDEPATVVGVCSDDIQDEINSYNSIIPMFTKASQGENIILASLFRDYSFVDTYYHEDVVFIGGNGLPSSILDGLNQLPSPLDAAADKFVDNGEIKKREGVKLFFKVAFSSGGSLDEINMSTCQVMSDGSYRDSGAVHISYQNSPFFFVANENKCNDYTATWTSGDDGYLQVIHDIVHDTSANCN